MFRSARHRSPITPRWVRGLLAGAFSALVSINNVGCGLVVCRTATSRRCT